MRNIIKIWFVTFISAVVPSALVHAYYIFMLDNCDPKFGCGGSLMIQMLMHGAGAIILSFAVSFSFYFVSKNKIFTFKKAYIVSSILIGVISSLLLKPYIDLDIGDDIGMFAGWFILPAFLSYIIYYVQMLIINRAKL